MRKVLTPEVIDMCFADIAAGETFASACAKRNIHRSTLERRIKQDPDLAERYKAIKENATFVSEYHTGIKLAEAVARGEQWAILYVARREERREERAIQKEQQSIDTEKLRRQLNAESRITGNN